MQQVVYVDDTAELERVCAAVGTAPCFNGMNAVLYVDGNIAGLCRLRLSDGIEFDEFKLAHGYDCFLNADFFFRAVLLKLTKTQMYIKINAVDERLSGFGFTEENGAMKVFADDVKFPSDCTH